MTGGLIQLVAKGVMDSLLTDIPEISYFKHVFRRHTCYAIETFEEPFNGSCKFGAVSECRLAKHGDLLADTFLKVELPSICMPVETVKSNVCVKGIVECFCDMCNKQSNKTIFSWANAIGHVMIEYIELQIGDKVIDRQTGEWLELWSELALSAEKRAGLNEMIGKKEANNFSYTSFPNAMSLIIPLNFYFCRNIGAALPVVSLMYEDIIIRIKWRDFHECYVSNVPNAKAKPINGFSASVYNDYIFLDVNERDKFINERQTYVIDQLRYVTQSFSKSVKHPKIDLNAFQLPAKELIWVLQRNDIAINVDNSMSNDWFNYGVQKNRMIMNKNNINETFTSGRILLNGMERTRNMAASYFRLAQPYKYHRRIPSNYIYTYTFCLKPEEQQPSGICNFSLFNNIALQLDNILIPVDYNVKVYCVNVNMMVIDKGIADILYSYNINK
jgi:hypothetical protein